MFSQLVLSRRAWLAKLLPNLGRWLIQRREYEQAFAHGGAPAGPPTFAGQVFPREYPVSLLDGDYDVFGDGSVRPVPVNTNIDVLTRLGLPSDGGVVSIDF